MSPGSLPKQLPKGFLIAMATKVHMEALSPTMEEGQLVRWLKSEGDAVSSGDILAEIETDKATMELVARGEGLLRKVLLREGGTAPVGAVIGIIGAAEEDIAGVVKDLVGSAEPPSGTEGEAEPEPSETEDADETAGARGAPPRGGVPRSAPAAVGEVTPAPAPEVADGGRIKASPLARRLAEEANLDLRNVRGSGPGGRIIKRDIEEVKAPEGGVSAAPGAPLPESRLRTPGVDFEDLPLSQMRKAIAKRLVESIGPVPHFFLRVTVDMTRVLAARKTVNNLLEKDGRRVSLNDFILKATAQALLRHPEVNAHWIGDSIRRHYRVHLGVAVAVEDGLITPVVRDAHQKGLAQISGEVRELAERGRQKRLQPEEYTGATFSVSNLGMYGIHEFTGVINPPEAGILAIGGVEETPVAESGEIVVRPLMQVTMSCDHRVIDGATGARFLQTLKAMLEEPAAMLA